MSFRLNRAINQQITNVIYFPEISDYLLEEKGINTISVYDIFQIEKIKHDKKRKYCELIINELKKTIPDLVDINFYKDLKNNDGIWIILELNKDTKNKSVTLGYLGYGLDDKFYFPFKDIISLEEDKAILLDKNKNIYKELANYGIENHFDRILSINTVSNRFKLSTFKDSLYINMPNELIHCMGKRFYISYYFNQDNFRNKIQTSEGIFNINTNIPGVKRLLSSNMNPKYFQNQELSKMIRFLKNLKVYESDVPEYLREEIGKVKVLK